MYSIFKKYIKERILVNNSTKSVTLAKTNIFSSNVTYENIELKTKDNVKIYAWYLKPKITDTFTHTILLLHGNNDNRETFCKKHSIEKFSRDYNFAFFIPDYRDFGDSEGEFKKQTVNFDIDCCLEYLKTNLKKQYVDVICISLGASILLQYIYDSSRHNSLIHQIAVKDHENNLSSIRKVAFLSPIKSVFDTTIHIYPILKPFKIMRGIANILFFTCYAYDNTYKIEKIMLKIW